MNSSLPLSRFFRDNPSVALAFSGGADSAYLLYAGRQCGAKIQPYFVKTAFQPAFELEDARRLCRELDTPLTVLTCDILTNQTVIGNPPDRCYFCKMQLFQTLWEHARADGYQTLIDGTNASDDAADRPGMRALHTLAVRSPLREYGLSKTMIRALSEKVGLFTWNKPAYACLATRIPTGTPITSELLCKTEQAETALFALGFSDLRVRVLENCARIQVKETQMEQVLSLRAKIIRSLSPYFEAVLLDLIPR